MQLSATSDWKNIKDEEILAQSAIVAALSGNWQEAVKINEKILVTAGNNVEALNRLAKALTCCGKHSKAEKIYKKVLGIDPYNIIAQKNLDKLKRSGGGPSIKIGNGSSYTNHTHNLINIFLDEPGKTKLVNLLNLAPPTILASLNCGDQLVLNPKNHSISVTSQDGTYIGAFPDDLAHRLLSFISGGNKYDAYVKNSTAKNLTIFVRETLRSEKFGNQPSFQSRINLFEEESR